MTFEPMTDEQLVQRIRHAALLHGDFTLRSGRKSKYYLDKYRFETEPDILAALAERLARHADERVDRLAGAELGGIPLVTATALRTGKPAIFIRNQKKDYGTAQQIEGRLERGDRVLVVEDIATTGGQVLEAAQQLTELGAHVVKIVAVIDRQEGARENIEAAGFAFESLLTKADLGIEE
ncbi:MAG: orotate phosphoribosyltransferase [Phycisphaeraceae bacterium]